jgi:hypothetical protein
LPDVCSNYFHSEMKRKASFPFAFRPIIRNFVGDYGF